VEVVPPPLEAPEPVAEQPIAPPEAVVLPRPQGLIEIVLSDGVTVRVDAGVNAHALRRVLDAVAGR